MRPSPRPWDAARPYRRRGSARCASRGPEPRSVTVTVSETSSTSTLSSNSVPACSTAFSASSLARSTAVSVTSGSRPPTASSTSCSIRRACRADRASGGRRIRRCSKAGTGAVCPVPLGAACAVSPGAAGRRAPGGPPRGSGPLRWRTGAGRRAVGGRPWRPRGEAETVTTARKARLDPPITTLPPIRRKRCSPSSPTRWHSCAGVGSTCGCRAGRARRARSPTSSTTWPPLRNGTIATSCGSGAASAVRAGWATGSTRSPTTARGRDGARAVNALIDDLAAPTAEIARVIEAVAEGDLSQHMALEIEGRPLRGEYRRIGRTVNTMVDQLSSFADEVTRVAREVGTDGRLGGQADVRGVAGTWRALTDSVNTMASNLTNQVRSISDAATAIARGDLSRTITVNARGEVAELADTINALTATLRLFADEVTRVAREVGTEGLLGGQAAVPGVAGTWKDLTDAVNVMAANLTAQVRGIAAVATAVERGDLSQKISVDAQGRDPRAQVDRQQDGRPARLVRRRGHPRGPRGRHRRAARRPGRGAQRRGHVARPHRQRQRAGVEPHDAGAQHRAGHHGGGARRPVAEDHRRGPGRDPGAQVDGEHDGRPARLVRRRGHPCGPRGRYRGQAGRAGAGARRVGHVARPHRQRQRAGLQPHRSGAQHRPGHHGGGARRPVAEDHRRGPGRDPGAQVDGEHDGRPARLVRRRGHPRGPRGRHRGRAGRAGAGARGVGHVARPHRERQPARAHAHLAAARDLGRGHVGGERRPHPGDPGRGRGGDRRPQGQHQPDDRHPPRDHRGERAAELARLQPRAHRRAAAGPARPRRGLPADHERGVAAGGRPGRGVLPRLPAGPGPALRDGGRLLAGRRGAAAARSPRARGSSARRPPAGGSCTCATCPRAT